MGVLAGPRPEGRRFRRDQGRGRAEGERVDRDFTGGKARPAAAEGAEVQLRHRPLDQGHGRYFYFVATYACPGPNAISPTFEVNFARLEHTALGRFNLAHMRHTGKWHELFAGLTLDECLKAIKDDPWFQP